MADFDNFDGNTGGFGEEDPVADFMARQKQQLEGIDDDLAFGSNSFAANAGTNEFEEPAEANQWGGEFAAPAATAANDYGAFEGEFEQTSDPKPAAPSDAYASIRQVDRQRQEPEKIRLWRVEQQEHLKKKDEESEKSNGEWRAVAKKELQDWYKHHDEQLDKKRRLNREAEKEFIAQRDDTVPGHEWERVGRLCDFNPKSVRTQKDVSRMRSILLQLKQTPLVKAS